MSADLSPMRGPANPRLRGAITTILMIMLVFMIVRDIFARRRDRGWLTVRGVTYRSSCDSEGCAARAHPEQELSRSRFRCHAA